MLTDFLFCRFTLKIFMGVQPCGLRGFVIFGRDGIFNKPRENIPHARLPRFIAVQPINDPAIHHAADALNFM